MLQMYGCAVGRCRLSPAFCEIYPGQPGWLLLEDFIFNAFGVVYRVPAGFWYNGASVPMLFWQLVCSPHDPRIIERALIHDWCYTSKIISREVADRLLIDDLPELGAVRRASIHAAVRAFGGLIAWSDTGADKRYLAILKNAVESTGRDFSEYLRQVSP